MSSHVGKVLALVALVAAVSWWLLRGGHDAPANRPNVSPELVAPGATVPVVPTSPPEARGPRPEAPLAIHSNTSARPELPAPRPDTAGGTPLTTPAAFATEPRDERWATATEADLRKRVAALADVHLESVECKTAHCKLALSGEATALSSGVDELTSGKAGLHTAIILSQPQVGSDGNATMTGYLTYPRPAEPESD